MRLVTMCGLLGMGGGFLWISPPLRQSVSEACGRGQDLLQANQPYSYVGVGAVVVVMLGFYMYRCAQPR
jgi:hypothetical protein